MKIKKVVASVFAITLIAGTAASNTGIINKIVPSNCITASAGVRQTSADGNWLFEVNSDKTATLYNYIGKSSRVYIQDSVKDSKTKKSYKVSEISTSIFAGNTNITYVAIPKGITEIPGSAFRNASNLKEVVLPHGLIKINSEAFRGTSLKQIYLPKTLEVIDYNAFEGTLLESVTLNEGIKKIGGRAFANTNLKSVTFPSSLEVIELGAFETQKYPR